MIHYFDHYYCYGYYYTYDYDSDHDSNSYEPSTMLRAEQTLTHPVLTTAR